MSQKRTVNDSQTIKLRSNEGKKQLTKKKTGINWWWNRLADENESIKELI
jgi:hypothetical protein